MFNNSNVFKATEVTIQRAFEKSKYNECLLEDWYLHGSDKSKICKATVTRFRVRVDGHLKNFALCEYQDSDVLYQALDLHWKAIVIL